LLKYRFSYPGFLLFAVLLSGCATFRKPSPTEERVCTVIKNQASEAFDSLRKEQYLGPRGEPIRLRTLNDLSEKFSFRIQRPKMPSFLQGGESGLGGFVFIGFDVVRSDTLRQIENVRALRSTVTDTQTEATVDALKTWRTASGVEWEKRFGNVDRARLIQEIVFCPLVCTADERARGCVSSHSE
jgi:hypothetical protein